MWLGIWASCAPVDALDSGSEDSAGPVGVGLDTGDTGGAGAGDGGGDGGDGGDGGAGSTAPMTFSRTRIGSPNGPAFVSAADVDDDGTMDLVVSSFGTLGWSVGDGTVELYRHDGALGGWSSEGLIEDGDGVKFPNQTTLSDLDGDGDLDIVVPAGFFVCEVYFWDGPCGGLSWLEQRSSGWTRHDVVPHGDSWFFHGVEVDDLDGDGTDDLVTVGEHMDWLGNGSAKAVWLRGTGGDFSAPVDLASGLGSFPNLRDMDGDGDQDLVGGEYFHDGGGFAWLENVVAPSAGLGGSWTRHSFDESVGPAMQLKVVADLYGDGREVLVGTNHTNTAAGDPWESAVYAWDPSDFSRTRLSTGIVSDAGSWVAPSAAPGVFGVGDLDADGDLDLAVAGDGDPRVFWLEQTSPGAFTTHVLEDDLTQAGGMAIADLDGDGRNELVVTGYDDDVVYLYEQDR